MTAEHGTPLSYRRGCRCDACRQVHAEYKRELRYRRARLTPYAEIPHGLNGYQNYLCRCATCREANTACMREQQANRLQRPIAAEHGLATTYNNWGCRCRPCTEAATARQRSYRQQRENQDA
jgi:hypothetical protein